MFAREYSNECRSSSSDRAAGRRFFAGLTIAAVTGVAGAQSLPIGGVAVLRMQQEQKTQAAEARQKKMASDADKLVVMAQQLKVSVDKTNKDVLSVDVIREAERIEKLAREVREGMRQ